MCNGTQEYPGENFINISKKTLTNGDIPSRMIGKLAKANSFLDEWLVVANSISIENQVIDMTLLDAQLGKEYMIRAIETDDPEMDSFLFSLGCYPGEPITVVSRRRGTCVVSIKDGRYTVGDELAAEIKI